ncbi:MAG: Holliday junction branch migration protein RuvA [Candidatus Babeliaceae bacterium]|nr:Holliday junction branch migration protein RuvA [Candidatus Babeliaceae bacterium]
MISTLKGIVQSQKNDAMVLQIAGFGLQVHIPENVIASIGSEVQLYTYFHWNQDQGPSLFGFFEVGQRDLFVQLISVSGIGPRMALALISAFSATALIEALISGNIALLSSVSGIGRKKAELLILSLKDKIQKMEFSSGSPDTQSLGLLSMHMRDLTDALISLGYSRQEILLAVEQLRALDGISKMSFDQLLRKSLQLLAKK